MGFRYLHPPFTLRLIVNDDSQSALVSSVRSLFGLASKSKASLPSASTCYNLLKLPAYATRAVLKEKLLHAIASGTGFYLR
jgi:ubiquitin-protein ligase E3 B